MSGSNNDQACGSSGCNCRQGINRREFVGALGLGAAGLISGMRAVAGPFEASDFEKLVPADKKLSPEWLGSLTARGGPTVYRGAELEKIGMPIGGICTGQLYVGGDGRLWHWDIFNQHIGTGDRHYAYPPKPSYPVSQGFAVRTTSDGKTAFRTLDTTGFHDVTFRGEYPLAFIEYRDPGAPGLAVSMEAFSPFIPLDAEDSNLPATVLRLTVKNTGAEKVEAELIGWHYTKEQRPGVIVLDGWMPWQDKPIVYTDGLKELGISEAFRKRPDASGYTQELRIPWKAIVKSGRAYRAGESFDCMLDVVWGPDGGKGWPVNHMMDLVAPGAVHTGWFWEVREIYGKVTLSPTGNLKLPPPAFLDPGAPGDESRPPIAGTIPLRVELPRGEAAARTCFTLAVNDERGQRVRSLPGDCRVEDYRLVDDPGSVEVMWDGLDDRGRLARPGKYQVVGLVRGAITPVYDMCFYNPGTPPWSTVDGRGAWGADHSPPCTVAVGGEMTVIGFAGAEGGSGLIGVGPDGLKKWGQQQGAVALAADERYAYFMLNDSWAGKRGLARLSVADGAYRPFLLDGRREYPLALERIFGPEPPGSVRGMAVHGGKLVLAMSGAKLAVLDAASAKLLKLLAADKPEAVAFSGDGRLYALLGGKLHAVDLSTGMARPISTPGLADARAIATDHDGNIAIADMGEDAQVKVYSPAGRLVYTAGRKGGRPIRGPFDPQAMSHVIAIGVDARGHIWAVENWEHPRRVSVWGRDGRCVRDYIGNTAYSACGTFLHDQDPTLAYAGPVEMRLDRAGRRWDVSQVL